VNGGGVLTQVSDMLIILVFVAGSSGKNNPAGNVLSSAIVAVREIAREYCSGNIPGFKRSKL
jgi:hypothetical protein